MILCPRSDFPRYAALHPGFPAVEIFLKNADLRRLPEGRTELRGPELFVSCTRKARGRGTAEAPLEAHRDYIDVQLVLKGVDTMGWAPLASCQDLVAPYDADKDIVFYRDAPQTWFQVHPGQVAIFFPEDAHAPLAGPNTPLHKVVLKVKADLQPQI